MTLGDDGSVFVAAPRVSRHDHRTADDPLPSSPNRYCFDCGQKLRDGRRKRCRRCSSIAKRQQDKARKHRRVALW